MYIYIYSLQKLVNSHSVVTKKFRRCRTLRANTASKFSNVRVTFDTLQLRANQVLVSLFAYFRHQWLTAVPTSLWNVNGEDMRTNNHCEGWHTRFNNAVVEHHPNIRLFLRRLQEEQATVDVILQQMAAGRLARRSNIKYVSVERRLKLLKTRHDAGTIDAIQFITGVSHNLAERK